MFLLGLQFPEPQHSGWVLAMQSPAPNSMYTQKTNSPSHKDSTAHLARYSSKACCISVMLNYWFASVMLSKGPTHAYISPKAHTVSHPSTACCIPHPCGAVGGLRPCCARPHTYIHTQMIKSLPPVVALKRVLHLTQLLVHVPVHKTVISQLKSIPATENGSISAGLCKREHVLSLQTRQP